jgi:hypothetical protein
VEYGREDATPCYELTYGVVCFYEDEIRSGHNAVVILLTERELIFRSSYPLPYEDEIRSVRGPYASREQQTGYGISISP